MKKALIFVGVLATAVTTISASTASWFLLHNPKLPQSMKK